MGPRRKASQIALLFFCVSVLVVGCTSASKQTTSTEAAISGNGPAVIVDNLDGPTQFTDGPSGWLLIAHLAGDEDSATGQVLAVDPESGERRVLVDRLDKPTGVAWLDGSIWVMERRRLVRARWDGGRAEPGPLEVIVDDLPFNGRSEGTLTVTPDRKILYETTGSMTGGTVVEGSGTLWVLDPATQKSAAVATGLKNAYAQVFLPDGRLLTTEIGDTTGPAPVEELNLVPYPAGPGSPVDAGWPTCAGDTECDGVVTPLATFAPHSTPTGVAVDESYAYVALLVPGEIRRVSLTGDASDRSESTLVVSHLQSPHTILLRPDGTLWVSETSGGRIIALSPKTTVAQ